MSTFWLDIAVEQGCDFTRSSIQIKMNFLARNTDKLARGVFVVLTQDKLGNACIEPCAGNDNESFAGVLLGLDLVSNMAVVGCGSMVLYTLYYDIKPQWKIGHLVVTGRNGEITTIKPGTVKPGTIPLGTVISLPTENDPWLGVRFKG